MRILLLSLLVTALISCNNQDKEAGDNSFATQASTVEKEILKSDAYKEYVEAYNNYVAVKQARPGLTNDLLEKKITSEEFTVALEENAKELNLRKRIFNLHYDLLTTKFSQEQAVSAKIMEE